MNFDTDEQAPANFHMGFVPDGIGPDGLPLYRQQVMINISRKPLLDITRIAEEDDFFRYRDQYDEFQRRYAKMQAREGYPLTMWPAVSLAELEMCHERDILTVEELAKKAGLRKLPPVLMEIGKRAKELIELQREGGRVEAIVSDLKAQLAAVMEQLAEANATISAQNTMLNRLTPRVA